MNHILLVVFCVQMFVADTVLFSEEIENGEWHKFKLEYSKEYENETEEHRRMLIFLENQNKIIDHNQRYENDEVTFKMAMNRFGDLTHAEFRSRMNCLNNSRKLRTFSKGYNDMIIDDPIYFVAPAHVLISKSVDWRKDGAVTKVKDQGDDCGSCWAFSTTGALEGQHFRKTKRLVSLSEQNLIDCSSAYGNEGCDGGWIHNAFQYIKDNGGIDSENSYPYKANERACKYRKKTSAANLQGFVNIPEGDEEKLMAAIATVGPLSVSIDSSHESFQFYSGGIYYEPKCHRSLDRLDHAMLAVGFAADKQGKEYYIVKNSYGTDWGESGYIKMPKNRRNHCGIATEATFPLV